MQLNEIAARMQLCHDTVKKMLRNEFEEKIQPYKEIVQKLQKKEDMKLLPALLKICEDPAIKGNEITVIFFMAAGVELANEKRIKQSKNN